MREGFPTEICLSFLATHKYNAYKRSHKCINASRNKLIAGACSTMGSHDNNSHIGLRKPPVARVRRDRVVDGHRIWYPPVPSPFLVRLSRSDDRRSTMRPDGFALTHYLNLPAGQITGYFCCLVAKSIMISATRCFVMFGYFINVSDF